MRARGVLVCPHAGPQPHVPQLFIAFPKVSVGEERGLEDPAGLTINNGLQIALYTDTDVRQAVPLVTDPGS
jgi:hypothetical protein